MYMGYWSSSSGRGSVLEEYINHTNLLYESKQMALIQKIPTPVKVTQKHGGIITQGFFEEKSTVDYVGVAQGVPICFDAKETKLKSLPLANIHLHQIEHMKKWKQQGGYSFLIVSFTEYNKYFLITLEELVPYFNNIDNGRKSIPLNAFKREIPIENGYLHYLKCVKDYVDESIAAE